MSNLALACACAEATHTPKFVVLTGGPGAGKTAVLETVSRQFCRHVEVLPESASLLFRGGFPRQHTPVARASAQRAIYHVQSELELLAASDSNFGLVLCDRGTLDGLAYWPHEPESYFAELRTTLERELARYAAVIHLRSPTLANGYNRVNPVRIESAEEALAIDEKIAKVWSAHPHLYTIDSQVDFVRKLESALGVIRTQVPACCAAVPSRAA